MTYPIPNLSRVWVRGRIIDLGKAATEQTKYGVGQSVTFNPSPKTLINAATKQVISSSSFKVAVSENNGYFQILLPATNDPDVNPTNFTYAVTEPGTGRSYNITVPIETPTLNSPGDPLHGQPVIELSDIQPAPGASAGLVQLVPGRGLTSIDIVSGDWVATFTDGGTQVIGPAPTGGGVSTLSELTDVSTTGATVGQIPSVDGVSPLHMSFVNIDELVDTTPVTAADFGLAQVKGARAYGSSTGQTITSGAYPVYLDLNTVEFNDDPTLFSVDLTGDRLVALEGGVFLVSWDVNYSDASGLREAYISKNGGNALSAAAAGAGGLTYRSYPMRLAADDYVQVICYVEGADVPLITNAPFRCGLALTRIGL